MKVTLYTDGAARGNPDRTRADTVPFYSLSIPQVNCMNAN